MCQAKSLSSSSLESPYSKSSSSFCVWPVSPLVIVVLLPLLPTWCFLNRGYTQWFHWNALFYCLTQNDFHADFLALQGLTVTLGWYASLGYDWYQHGRFGHILYWNMPSIMTQYILDDSSTNNHQVIYNPTSIAVMLLAHVLDTVGHPLLAYYFWNRRQPQAPRRGSSSSAAFSWSILLSTYALSRVWSLLHNWHNHAGMIGFFYFGYNVYTVLDKDAWLPGFWLPAYVMEGLVYVVLIVHKVWFTTTSSSTTTRPQRHSKELTRSDMRMPPMRRSSTLGTLSESE